MSSKHRHGGLGRGLGALIPTAPAANATSEPGTVASPTSIAVDARPANGTAPSGPSDTSAASVAAVDAGTPAAGTPAAVPGAVLVDLPIKAIHANAKQPRQVFDEDALAELSHSIREFGVLQPVVVRQVADSALDGGADSYELVMGERRLRAAVAAGLDSIPAIVRTTEDDAMLRDALLENIHRVQLNPLEEAAAYQQLLDEFGTTHDELAARIGRSRPQVSNTIRLLNLPLPVQRRVAAGVLSAGHARALLGLGERDQQDELAGRIVAEGLSVRATEELVSLAQRADTGADGESTARRSSRPKLTAPGVAALAGDLSDAFDTRVRVDLGRRKGKITIEFASIDDLERIVGLMSPDVAGTRASRGQANEP
ncbi:ParB/RepB/Spo0J family partition protein [Jatrophihabitans endophyticus]|uniref:ParB/RepB/Spo0J family partition protein n=1 Tax=Jatrophihabitans endophyticus TaxID=1206085 RepID=UPI0019F80618|nr:ParB/RepB/Spo0J family partition protein [Jatrophihabitans endophyticus]MBE7189624.1 ParB/RepB/Spo0J family partition protein [Jatrophihabitans endophyticus]